MITPRTLALFHFGLALVFLAFAVFFVFLFHVGEPSPILPTPHGIDQTIRQSIVKDENLESLRSVALQYYDQSSLLMQELAATAIQSVDNVLYVFGFSTFVFLIGGVMSLRVSIK